ncbi:MAG TPA: S8 family serine peptidase [Jatrophihabitantaceae bacterium]|nr:S8 family serine peptidase [Jatrophihabitantaceae bacterium]
MRRALPAILLAGIVLAPAAAATPGDPYAPQYYFDTWHVTQLWQGGARGQGITIAEIDTGVDANLAVFRGRVLTGIDFGRLGGDGRVDRDKNPYGHGTSMASIMVGRPGQFGIEGLAPGAKVLPVAIPLAGTTDAADDDRLAFAIRWAANHGAKIISMSLGGVRRPSHNATACPDDEQQAIYHALRKGAVVLAASGNRGDQDNAVEEPGVCLGVVSVGAVTSSGSVAHFSSRQNYLTMTAPGVAIASIGHDGSPYSGAGTSQATAVASGATALVWSKFPRLTGSQLVGRLLATADQHGDSHDSSYGYGTINPYRAITSAVATDSPDPVYAAARPFMQAGPAPIRPPPPPTPVARADKPPGSFSVGAAPRLAASRVLIGSAVAAGALAALVLLLVVGLVAHRRRRLAAVAPPLEPWPVEPPWSPAGPATSVEYRGLEWRDVWSGEQRSRRPDDPPA